MPSNRLEVELDFHHTPGQVVVRCYRFAGGQRTLLRAQQLHNLSRNAGRGIASEWPEPDQRFLRELLPEVSQPGLLKSNLQVIRITPQKLELWLTSWQEEPERFIERSSQQPYAGQRPVAQLRVRLECHDRRTTMTAHLVAPDGREGIWHSVRRRIDLQRRQVALGDRVYDIDLPLQPEMLDRIFADGGPTVPTDAVVQHLPTVLKGRVDLLEGPDVERRSDPADARLELVADGADVLLRVWLGPAALPSLDAEAACLLRRRGGRFIVEEKTSAALPAIQAALAPLPLRQTTDYRYRLPGAPANIAALVEAWLSLPPEVEITYDDKLRGLFEDDVDYQLCLQMHPGEGWLDLDLGCQVGDRQLGSDELEQALANDEGILRHHGGSWLRLPAGAMGELRQLLDDTELGIATQRLTPLHAAEMLAELDRFPDLRLHRSAHQLADDLRQRAEVGPAPLPPPFPELLRSYQVAGANFLCRRAAYTLGCVLADDMGLGKTLQVLAYLSAIRAREPDAPGSLVVCPASVVSVWLGEAARFAPDLRVGSYAGTPEQRRRALAAKRPWDLLVATYGLVRNDFESLGEHKFHTLILDEAQQIKNPDAKITGAVKALRARQRICATGTPLENRLLDLYSIVDFLNPGYLGVREEFHDRYVRPGVEPEELRRRIAPLILRRTKQEVEPELPPRTDEMLTLPMAEEQRLAYDRELVAIRAGLATKGAIEILAGITRLRQICCHPNLLAKKDAATEPATNSAKLDCLMGMLAELAAEGHSALVFSQFTSMLAIIEEALRERAAPFYKITGETPTKQRPLIVKEFTDDPRPSVFLLSLRAAGAGITLTKAGYVFIYDPWWNPAVENQAVDRAHRIGQTSPVIAYRLVAANSIEDKVLALQDEKRQLFASMIDGAGQAPADLSRDDLIALLQE